MSGRAFNRRFELHELSGESDGLGGEDAQWLFLRNVWARVTPAASMKAVRAGADVTQIGHVVEMRHATAVAPGMRLISGATVLEILSCHDPDGTGRYLRCEAVEIV